MTRLPGLASVRDVGDPNETPAQRGRRHRWNAQADREREQQRKRDGRLQGLEDLLLCVPLRPGAKDRIPSFVDLFEQTYLGISRDQKVDPPKEDIAQMRALSKMSRSLADHVDSMDPTIIMECVRAGTPLNRSAAELIMAAGINIIDLPETLRAISNLCDQATQPYTADKKAGRHPDRLADEMTQTARFVFEMLSPRKAGIANSFQGAQIESEFSAFLAQVFDIYGIAASAMSRAKRRKRRLDKN